VEEADVDEPGLGEAVDEAAAGFAGGVGGTSKQAVLIAVEEDAEGDEDDEADDADDFQAEESFGAHDGEQGSEVGVHGGNLLTGWKGGQIQMVGLATGTEGESRTG